MNYAFLLAQSLRKTGVVACVVSLSLSGVPRITHLRMKHKVYKKGTESIPQGLIGRAIADIAYHALISTIRWNNQGSFLALYQDALNKLAIPAISAEYERVFS
jgi:hypothetical protein